MPEALAFLIFFGLLVYGSIKAVQAVVSAVGRFLDDPGAGIHAAWEAIHAAWEALAGEEATPSDRGAPAARGIEQLRWRELPRDASGHRGPATTGQTLTPMVAHRTKDVLTHRALSPGETVYRCPSCESVYSEPSLRVVQAELGGRCLGCKKRRTFDTATVGRPEQGAPPRAPCARAAHGRGRRVAPPAAAATGRTPVQLAARRQSATPAAPDGTPSVSVSQAREHLGQRIWLVGEALAVRWSRSGRTLFLDLTRAAAPRDRLKVVLFPVVVAALRARSVEPAAWQGRPVMARGVLHDHPIFGPQLICSSADGFRPVAQDSSS